MSDTLASQLVTDILQRIQTQALAAGTRLSERKLAEALRVSRSPVRVALQQMAEQQLVDPHPSGGYVVGPGALATTPTPPPDASFIEKVYLQIAQDRLDERLPPRVSENALMRRYEISRGQLTEILRRIAHEGWIERLPGHGWAFTEAITTGAAYAQGYHFRILLEPGGILQPTYRLDEAGLEQCRKEQQALAGGTVEHVSPAQIFDANSRLHETIAASSGNAFMLDALRRLNRIRRLMEYRKAIDRQQALRRCEEHLVLIELLLSDRRQAASDFMRQHLQAAARDKETHDASEAAT